MLMPSPITHITGFVDGIELPFFTDVQTAFMEVWEVSAAVSFIKQVGATTCLSATPFLQQLVDACEASGETLPTMRFFACGGASVPPGLIYSTHRVLANCRSFRVYGSTEAPLVTVGFLLPLQERLAAETDGEIYNWEVRVEDEDGHVLGTGENGEIMVRGPAMMLGYGDPEQTRTAISEEGFFHTGDIGYVTADRAIVITDRKKDIIIRGGENLSAREIEDVLHSHPDIQHVAAVSMPHERLGEGVCAVVVLRDGADKMTVGSLKPFLDGSGLAKQKWPERLEVRTSLPMTASGKIRKDILRAEIKAAIS
jgi:acyl-CoA synthetase (AMP-forming)/AMP-acid ligase II